VEQARAENRSRLIEIGGLDTVCKAIGVSIDRGLTPGQVETMRSQFGDNTFPDSPLSSFFSLLLDAFSDTTLLVLLAAAAVSLGIGVVDDPQYGWIEGAAIFIAVFLVANISAANDYSKEMQFRALEQSAQLDERASVLRDGVIERINPIEIVVGDILVVQVGDAIMADGILVSGGVIESNESSLTGESKPVKKSKTGDCFLLSSCLVTGGDEGRILVTGIGQNSQWGRIKVSLVSEPVNTPLQDKLEVMSTQVGHSHVKAISSFVIIFGCMYLDWIYWYYSGGGYLHRPHNRYLGERRRSQHIGTSRQGIHSGSHDCGGGHS
jgi:Ca2+-transporting ATPase